MTVTGYARFAGSRSGLTKEGEPWGSAVLDNPDNLMERIQTFVRDKELITACQMLPSGCDVEVTLRLYASKDGIGSTLLSIVPLDSK